MSLHDRIEKMKEKLPKERRDIAHYVEHALEAIVKLEENHRKLVAARALSGEKIHGQEERMFYDTLSELKLQLVATFEKTAEDFIHKGDKYWEKNFKDGVE